MKIHTSMPMTLAIQGAVTLVSLSALSVTDSRTERVTLLIIAFLSATSMWLTLQEEKVLIFRIKHLQILLQEALSAPAAPRSHLSSTWEDEEETEGERPPDWQYLLEQTVRQYNSPPDWPFHPRNIAHDENENDEKGRQRL